MAVDDRRWTPAATAGVAIVVTTVAVYALLVALTVLAPRTTTADESVIAGALWLASWVPFGVVGGILVAKRPTNPIGWQLSAIAVPLLLVVLLDHVAVAAVARGATSVPVAWLAWLAGWLYAPTVPLLGLLIASFPSGRIRNRLLRRLAPVSYATIAGIALARALRPGPTDIAGIVSPLTLPVARSTFDVAIQIVTGVAVAYGLVAAGDLAVRYLRSTGVERRQLKWFVASLGWFVAMFLVLLLGEDLLETTFGPELGEVIGTLTFTLGLGGMAVAIGVAVLRYRLFEIDRIVSRTVTYAVLTVLLAAIYGGLVLGAQVILGPQDVPDVVIAASTLLVAALFGPVRRRVQRTVDRRFNRASYDAARTAATFATWLRSQVDLATITGQLRGAVSDSLRPTRIDVWLVGEALPASETAARDDRA